MNVTPSDHIIENEMTYSIAILEALVNVIAGAIVTFGIQATKPETGYGYLEYKGDTVLSFREKTNEVTPKQFISKGTFFMEQRNVLFSKGCVFKRTSKIPT